MTIEQCQKIAWLNRAFYAEKLAKALKDKCSRDKALAERITRSSDGTSGGTAGNSTESALMRLAETEEKLQNKLRELVHLREEIYAAITAVADPELEAVLIRRYLNYESMELIAEKMNYDKRTIQRKHKAALNKLVIECHPEM